MILNAILNSFNTKKNISKHTPLVFSKEIVFGIFSAFRKVITQDPELQSKVEKWVLAQMTQEDKMKTLARTQEQKKLEEEGAGVEKKEDPNPPELRNRKNPSMYKKPKSNMRILSFGVLASASAAAAQPLPAGLSIEIGATDTNLCAGLYGCIQSIVRSTTTRSVLATFSRTIQQALGQASVATKIALENCFTQKTLRALILEIITVAPNNWQGQTNCSASSFIMGQDTGFLGRATELSEEGCIQFQNVFNNATAGCQIVDSDANASGISVRFMAVALGVVVFCGSCSYLYRYTDKMYTAIHDCIEFLSNCLCCPMWDAGEQQPNLELHNIAPRVSV